MERLSGKTALAFELKVGSDDPQESPPACVLHGSVRGKTQLVTQLTCTGGTATQPTHRPGADHLANQLTPEPSCANFLCDAQLFSPPLHFHHTRSWSNHPLLFCYVFTKT